MKNTVIARRDGFSSTGTLHPLLIEEVKGKVRFTVLGADGKKRHASTDIEPGEAVALLETLQAFVNER